MHGKRFSAAMRLSVLQSNPKGVEDVVVIGKKRVTIADRNTGQIRVGRDLIFAGIELRARSPHSVQTAWRELKGFRRTKRSPCHSRSVAALDSPCPPRPIPG